jgi:hypothetical protein
VRRTLLEELGDSRDVEFFFRHAEHHLNDVIHTRLHAYTVDFEKYHRRGPRGALVSDGERLVLGKRS